MTRAPAILDLDENDTDVFFTLGAYLLLDGKAEEALTTPNLLALLDPDYPGIWWVKALVFDKLGKKRAAEWAPAGLGRERRPRRGRGVTSPHRKGRRKWRLSSAQPRVKTFDVESRRGEGTIGTPRKATSSTRLRRGFAYSDLVLSNA